MNTARSRGEQDRALLAIVVDAAATVVALLVALWLRHPDFLALPRSTLVLYGALAMVIVALWYACLSLVGAYRRLRSGRRLAALLQGVLLGHLVLGMVLFYGKVRFLSRAVMLAFFVLDLGGLVLGRRLVERLASGALPRRLLVVAPRAGAARRLADALGEEEGVEVVGWVQAAVDATEPAEDSWAPLAGADALREVIVDNAPIDQVAFAATPDRPAARDLARLCEDRGLVVREQIVPLGEDPTRPTVLEHVAGLDILTTVPGRAAVPGLLAKRALDILGGLVGMGMTAVMYPFLALAIRLDSRGPVLYSQERVGLNGRVFRIYKFRTMVQDAEQRQDELREAAGIDSPHFRVDSDPRVTRVGAFLRKTSLDEFPQFWNVLVGDMSLVGPRPFDRAEVERHEWHFHKRLGMKPGLTGVWQVSGRKDIADFEKIVAMDAEYIRNWSLGWDLELIARTLPVMFRGDGAR